MLYPTEL